MFFDEPASILSLEVNNQSCCLHRWRFTFFLHDSISRRNCLDVCFCVMIHTRRCTDDNGSGIVFGSQREDNFFLHDSKMCCRRCLPKCWLTFPSDVLTRGNPLRWVLISAKPHWLSDAAAGIWLLISSREVSTGLFLLITITSTFICINPEVSEGITSRWCLRISPHFVFCWKNVAELFFRSHKTTSVLLTLTCVVDVSLTPPPPPPLPPRLPPPAPCTLTSVTYCPCIIVGTVVLIYWRGSNLDPPH